jgi:hypothetical protein
MGSELGLKKLTTVTINHQQTKNRRLPDRYRQLLCDQHKPAIDLLMTDNKNSTRSRVENRGTTTVYHP